MKTWVKMLFFLVFGINAFAFPIVTDVQDPTFSGVDSQAFHITLQKLRRVDFEQYPELEPGHQQIIELVENLLIEEDGKRPIRVVFVDSMIPNAFFYGGEEGDRVLGIHLGLLRYLTTDDQLAYILGHELEHGLSVLNHHLMNKPNEHNPLLQRVVENEVDVKSVFNRVHANGMNPYGSLDVLEILKELGDDHISPTHTMTSNRMNTMEQALTGMTRVIGERINQIDRTEIITPSLRAFLGSDEFLQKRKNTVEMSMSSYKERIDHVLGETKNLESVPENYPGRASAEVRQEYWKIRLLFLSNRTTVDEQLYGIVSDTATSGYTNCDMKVPLSEDLFEGVARTFGNDMEIRTV